MSRSATYSEKHAKHANLSLSDFGITSWEKPEVVKVQAQVGATQDGWFGPKSIRAWKAWKRRTTPKSDPQNDLAGKVIVDGIGYAPPRGVKVVNHLEAGGIPAMHNDTSVRKHPLTQFVLHRGAQGTTKREGYNYARTTERVLDSKGLSTTFTQDIDGVIYQHFDPGPRRGRHCLHHNVQSDSLDVAGPFEQKRKPQPGQKKLTLRMAIGRRNDGVPPLQRRYGTVKCWSMPQAQVDALALFLPWYCKIRGIPVTACEDWRTFRVGGLGRRDPVTSVKGIIAHTQVARPGTRVDGILPLHQLKEAGADIKWRSSEDFFET